MSAALPAGWGLHLDGRTRRIDDGTVLVGGAPLRILRLSAAGRRLVDRWMDGEPVGGAGNAQLLARRLLDSGIAHPRPERCDPPFAAKDVSVVVPTRGGADGLARTLARLGHTGEVVVVDDGSPEPAALAAIGERAGARVIRHGSRQGPGAARETGWRTTHGDVVAFVDDDVDPTAGWLDLLLPHLADPRVVAVAPRIVVRAEPSTPRWLADYESARSPLDLGAEPATVRPGSPVPYVPTTVLVVRRQALHAVGGFDDDLRFGEDVDLVWRLVDQGWTVRYEPAATATHPTRPTLPALARQRFDYGTSAAPLGVRHGRAVAPLHVSGWSAGAWALVLTGHPIASLALGAGTTGALVPKLRCLRHPLRESLRLAGLGNLLAGRHVADALRRPWLPLSVLLWAHRRARPALVAAALVPPLLEWRERRPRLDPARWLLLRLADDAAYSAGVWRGALHARSARALLPAFTGPIRQEGGATAPGPPPAGAAGQGIA